MSDRSKVIVGIAVCLSPSGCGKDCPYYNDRKNRCKKQLRNDALELLKEQEPVKPIRVQREETLEENEVFTATDVWAEWYCPKCHKKIAERYSPHAQYCMWCGRAVKWDGP